MKNFFVGELIVLLFVSMFYLASCSVFTSTTAAVGGCDVIAAIASRAAYLACSAAVSTGVSADSLTKIPFVPNGKDTVTYMVKRRNDSTVVVWKFRSGSGALFVSGE
jgi:hypothetical protein